MPEPILIVEDNEMSMKLFSDVLEAHGHTLVKSVDGCDVLELARVHTPTLILMDIQLPKASGIDLTKQIKADDKLKDIAVVAVTVFSLKGLKDQIMAAGFDDFIPKPIVIPDFIKTINRFVN